MVCVRVCGRGIRTHSEGRADRRGMLVKCGSVQCGGFYAQCRFDFRFACNVLQGRYCEAWLIVNGNVQELIG